VVYALLMAYKVVTDYTTGVSENANVKVFVRARPPARDSEEVRKFIEDQYEVGGDNPKRIAVKDIRRKDEQGGSGEHAFQFDRVFWTEATQAEIFNTICVPQVEHCLRGYNSCCFAYGQTGSGKTHSMFGGDGTTGNERGVIPRSVEYLFQQLHARASAKDVAIVVSFLEIYCDKIRDLGLAYKHQGLGDKTSDVYMNQQMRRSESFSRGLMRDTPPGPLSLGHQSHTHGHGHMQTLNDLNYGTMDLQIKEDQTGMVFVKDLAMVPVGSAQEVMDVIQAGLKLRATHETKMNSVSSRSHTVFTITVIQRDKSTGSGITGKLNLVDLAGSERLKKSESEGIRLKEALHINTSLTALGKVVMALDPNSESLHVPYRDSKLTRILQNSLGGNSFTTVLATIHPSHEYMEECLSTLQFANRCRVVQNQPRVTYVGRDEDDKDRRIKALTDEVTALRRRMGHAGGDLGGDLGLLDEGIDGGELLDGLGNMPSGERQKMLLKKQRDALIRATNKMLLNVLNDCGIEATLAPDGRVQLPDGRLVGHPVQGLDDASMDGTDSVTDTNASGTLGPGRDGSGGGSGSGGAGGGRSGKDGLSKDVRRFIRSLEKERNSLQRRLDETKETLERVHREHHKEVLTMQRKHREEAEELRASQSMLKGQVEHLHEVVELTKSTLASAHDDQIKHLVQRSDELLRQQAEFLRTTAIQVSDLTAQNRQDGRPEAVVDYQSGETGTRRNFPLSDQKLHATLRAQESSKITQLENLKEQYEYWLRCKAQESEKFVEDFNRYRRQQKERQDATELELLRLYHYACSTADILAGVEKGIYPMRQKGRATVPCVHPEHRPQEPNLLARTALPHPTGPAGGETESSDEDDDATGEAGGAWGTRDGAHELPDHLPMTRALLKRTFQDQKRRAAFQAKALEAGVTMPVARPPRGAKRTMLSPTRKSLRSAYRQSQVGSQVGFNGYGREDHDQSHQTGAEAGMGRGRSRKTAAALLQGTAGPALRRSVASHGSKHGTRPGSAPRLRGSTKSGNAGLSQDYSAGMSTARGRLESDPPANWSDASSDEEERAEAMDNGAIQNALASLPAGDGSRIMQAQDSAALQLDLDGFVAAVLAKEDCDTLDRVELVHRLELARQYMEQAVPMHAHEIALAELKSSDTVEYVSQLEQKLVVREEQIADQSRRLNELKIAHEALSRRMSGMTKRETKQEYGAGRHRVREDGSMVQRGHEALSRPSARGFKHVK